MSQNIVYLGARVERKDHIFRLKNGDDPGVENIVQGKLAHDADDTHSGAGAGLMCPQQGV